MKRFSAPYQTIGAKTNDEQRRDTFWHRANLAVAIAALLIGSAALIVGALSLSRTPENLQPAVRSVQDANELQDAKLMMLDSRSETTIGDRASPGNGPAPFDMQYAAASNPSYLTWGSAPSASGTSSATITANGTYCVGLQYELLITSGVILQQPEVSIILDTPIRTIVSRSQTLETVLGFFSDGFTSGTILLKAILADADLPANIVFKTEIAVPAQINRQPANGNYAWVTKVR